MNRLAIALVALMLPTIVLAASDADTEKAVVAWLNLVDQQKYEAGYADSSPKFKERIPEKQWEEALIKVREPLGAVTSRKLDKVIALKSLPGLPDGDYAVVQFQTTFANKANAVETITLIPEGTTPKVAGYFVK